MRNLKVAQTMKDCKTYIEMNFYCMAEVTVTVFSEFSLCPVDPEFCTGKWKMTPGRLDNFVSSP